MDLDNILVESSQNDQRESELLIVLTRLLYTQCRRLGRRSIVQTVDQRHIHNYRRKKRNRERTKTDGSVHYLLCSNL